MNTPGQQNSSPNVGSRDADISLKLRLSIHFRFRQSTLPTSKFLTVGMGAKYLLNREIIMINWILKAKAQNQNLGGSIVRISSLSS